ncbi:MAG: hypothetical protein K2W96_01715 [Gemmataceae bacterium]|nr:hypothetical protein [Gemmataceae bacterium]
MTEAEWLACEEPEKILAFILSPTFAINDLRKDRLFVCACCRQAREVTREPVLLDVVGRMERYEDDEEVEWEQLVVDFDTTHELEEKWKKRRPRASLAAGLVNLACMDDTEMLRWVYPYLLDLTRKPARPDRAAWAVQVARCIWGTLHYRRPVLGTAWLAPGLVSLAQAAYDERLLPSGHLDNARLAVLSDALEEAGCADADLLPHLRSPGPHVRGCWALDIVLGKN